MESRVYSSRGTSRYDSWDIENLKYIRRKSQSNLLDDFEYSRGEGNNYKSLRMEESSLESDSSYKSVNQFKESDEMLLHDLTIYSGPRKSRKEFLAPIPAKPLEISCPKEDESSRPEPSLSPTWATMMSCIESASTALLAVRPGLVGPPKPTFVSGLESSTHKNGWNKDEEQKSFHSQGESSAEEASCKQQQQGSCLSPRSINSLESEESGETRLADCYLLDVVTIRNESLFTQPKNEKIGREKKSKIPVFIGSKSNLSSKSRSVKSLMAVKEGGGKPKGSVPSDGTRSTSSVSSTDEALNNNSSHQNGSYQEKREKPPLYVVGGSVGSRSTCSAASSDLDGSTTSRKQRGGCPFCSDSSSTSSYYLGRQGKKSCSGETSKLTSEEEEEEMRTPSPYYVRLRRDLCNYTPPLCTPRNFGMDKQGQLVIDYSQNWQGLESYIKHLQLI